MRFSGSHPADFRVHTGDDTRTSRSGRQNRAGTEFRLDVLFFYKRTIAMNLVSSGFQKTDATSTIEYDVVGETSAR